MLSVFTNISNFPTYPAFMGTNARNSASPKTRMSLNYASPREGDLSTSMKRLTKSPNSFQGDYSYKTSYQVIMDNRHFTQRGARCKIKTAEPVFKLIDQTCIYEALLLLI